MGSNIFLYDLVPFILMYTNVHIRLRAMPIRIIGNSKIVEILSQPSPIETSRINATLIYAITPITIDSPNHCEKLAINPRTY